MRLLTAALHADPLFATGASGDQGNGRIFQQLLDLTCQHEQSGCMKSGRTDGQAKQEEHEKDHTASMSKPD
ncbi:hypothetical protein CLOP_g2935 [Closterium sp. NIES-67]|nr:hypothetical protein CLOP_g2935 [Closterium sp. NIES-67]